MAILKYTAWRIAVVAVAAAVLFALGMRGWLWLAAAIVAGWPMSYLLLRGPRRAATGQLEASARARAQRRYEQRSAVTGEDEQAEDAEIG